MSFTISYNGEEVLYSKEEQFIGDLFGRIISNQFIFSSLDNIKLNFESAIDMLLPFLDLQKKELKEKRKQNLNIIKHNKDLYKEYTGYSIRLSKLVNKIKNLHKFSIDINDSLKFRENILNFILSLEGMSNLSGFILGADNKQYVGNAEINSWTFRRKK